MGEEESRRRLGIHALKIPKLDKIVALVTFGEIRFSADDHREELVTPMMTAFGIGNDENVVRSGFE